MMAMDALLVICPAEVDAAAESEWLPLESAVVSKDKVNGALVKALPELPPSTSNWTLVVLEETLATTLSVPETVAPEPGEVMDTVGAAEGTLICPLTRPPQPAQISARTPRGPSERSRHAISLRSGIFILIPRLTLRYVPAPSFCKSCAACETARDSQGMHEGEWRERLNPSFLA